MQYEITYKFYCMLGGAGNSCCWTRQLINGRRAYYYNPII